MKRFSIDWAIGKRQFQSLTGVTSAQFLEMASLLRPQWGHRIIRSKNRAGRPWGVGDLEDHLLVLLILYRCHITQDFLACLYGVDKATICRSLKRIEGLARRVLGVRKNIHVTAEEAQNLIMDCTEQPVQRPSRKQRCWYSGKKKRHTVKNEIIVTGSGKIAAVSDDAPGRVHDIEIRRRGPPLPKDARGHADSGYQGYQNDHPELEIPYKKSRKNPLTKDERQYNHALSRFRVRVEHTIAKIKSFRILSDRFRYPRPRHIVKFSIVAGIVNLVAGF
jgi:DDE superfamily endonuclease/Helix-turn-helix of DDE superfamily endonuclease